LHVGSMSSIPMPKKVRPLSAIEVSRKSKVPGVHNVGGVWGLYLQVSDSLATSWILNIKIGDDRAQIGLGGYPDTTLSEARQKAKEYRAMVEQGVDPREAKRAAKAALKAAQAKSLTFDQAKTAYLKTKSHEFRNDKHAKQWHSTLDTYASPKIGSIPVAEIELSHVVSVLEPIWTTKTETAVRLRGRMESVLGWAKVSGYRFGDNPARWRGNLDHVLPKPSRIRKVVHLKALPWQELPGFMVDLRKREGMAARALEFAILTWARSGEVRLATWAEIDIERKLWVIPASRMKSGREHRVPLSDPAVKLLKALPRFEGSDYVFPAPKGGPLSDMALSAVCRRMEVDAVPHGFRSSAKDWARSSTSYADEVSELALAHVSTDATRAAYARDELLPKRRNLMRDWAAYLSKPTKRAKVTPIRGAK
jgi:integrase